jgi:hypothetical protein
VRTFDVRLTHSTINNNGWNVTVLLLALLLPFREALISKLVRSPAIIAETYDFPQYPQVMLVSCLKIDLDRVLFTSFPIHSQPC